jgi:hypothetical protein
LPLFTAAPNSLSVARTRTPKCKNGDGLQLGGQQLFIICTAKDTIGNRPSMLPEEKCCVALRSEARQSSKTQNTMICHWRAGLKATVSQWQLPLSWTGTGGLGEVLYCMTSRLHTHPANSDAVYDPCIGTPRRMPAHTYIEYTNTLIQPPCTNLFFLFSDLFISPITRPSLLVLFPRDLGFNRIFQLI